ncbi:MAG TPA: 6-phosphofructokinase [Nitrospirae bacterium]|nr:pyrophosphate--fructose 6-phosphate 1-phosphotransferase [bacterium BMS3Abin08]HDY70734.1 6-phosphofructokinase [Nitrospirota bacterium]
MSDNLGIVVGGGPAPGINGVISSAAIEAINSGLNVLGIRDGFRRLYAGDMEAARPLRIEDVSMIHIRGGSLLRTSRDYPAGLKAGLKRMMKTLFALNIRYLITIGGDGTSYMARLIESESLGRVSVVHVPKTIDNDLPLPGGMPTFGFETARDLGVKLVKNLMEDARTMGRWYFVTTMGRYTGHLALGIGKAAGATVIVIPEEFSEKRLSFRKVADVLEGSIIKRLFFRRDYGVAILAEGIADRLNLAELKKYEEITKDETGRVRLSEIQLGRVMKHFVQEDLEKRGIRTTIVDKNIGYELRAADPVPFDVEYTRNLGYGAVRYLLNGGSGAMIVMYDGHLRPIPLKDLVDPLTDRTRIRSVSIRSEGYEVARKYMIRLDRTDFRKERIGGLAEVAGMTPGEFKKRFYYLVKNDLPGF